METFNMTITIPGNPIPQPRPRVTSRGVYNPVCKEKKVIALQMKPQAVNQNLVGSLDERIACDSHYFVTMVFFMPIHKGVSKKRIKEIVRSPHVKKPDIDNIVKFYMDCGNEILWRDDCMIHDLRCKKVYSDNPRTVIEITIVGEYAPLRR